MKCDVLIAGGGMVGASLAAALARLPVSVGLVEPIPAGVAGQPSFDDRTTALSRSSRQILGALGLWDALAGQAAPVRRVHVSEQGRFGTAVIDADEQRVEALGYVVANRELGRVLWGDLAGRDNVSIHAPATAIGIEEAGDALQVKVEQDGRQSSITTRLLVVADGSRSRLREALGIGAIHRPYGQVAIVGNVGVSGPRSAIAYERFTPRGPLALLPAGDQRYVFVLTRQQAEAGEAAALPDPAFLRLLQREFGFRLGRFTRLGSRSQYPLELVQSASVTAPRAAIVGNAAHGLHPVAGQGYNLGLRDSAALAELVADELRGPTGMPDPGRPELLARYADWRRPDQRKVVAFTDGLVRLFELEGLGGVRGLGLLVFDALPGARGLLARQTMGLGGRRSRLSRGLSS